MSDETEKLPRDGKVLFDWTPTEAAMVTKHDDVADRYLVFEVPKIPGGIIVYAKYRGEWMANPWSHRALVAELLKRLTAAAPPRST